MGNLKRADMSKPHPNHMQLRRENLKDFVIGVVNPGDSGARVQLRQNGVLVTDIASWPQSFSDMIRDEYPSSRIMHYQSDSSVSGFSVLISFGNENPFTRNYFIMFLVLCGLLAFVMANFCFTLYSHHVTPNKWVVDADVNQSSAARDPVAERLKVEEQTRMAREGPDTRYKASRKDPQDTAYAPGPGDKDAVAQKRSPQEEEGLGGACPGRNKLVGAMFQVVGAGSDDDGC